MPIITLPLDDSDSSVNLFDGTHKTRKIRLAHEY